MTGPLGPASKAITKAPNPVVGKAAGVAAVLASLWMMRESFNGAKDEWIEHYQAYEDNANMELWSASRANYSGQPSMDNWALQLKEFLTYGIAGSRMSYIKGKMMVEGFVNDVLLPNLLPLGIASAGVYMGLGDNGRKAITSRMKNADFKIMKSFGGAIGNMLKPLGNGILKMMGKTSEGVARHPVASLALIGLGLFGANRFQQVYSGEQQQDFFRKTVSPPQGH